MKLYDFLPEQTGLDEAAMNPTEFDRAVAQGQQAGVLVGFEFEVHVPEATITGGDPETNKEDDKYSMVNFQPVFEEWVDDTELEAFSPDQFDNLFAFKQPVNGFDNMQTAAMQMTDQKLAKIREVFDQIPEKIRADTIEHVRREYPRNRIPRDMSPTSQLRFFKRFAVRIYYYNNKPKTNQLASLITHFSNFSWEDLMSFVYAGTVVDQGRRSGTAVQISGHFDQYFEFKKPMEEVWDELNLDEYEDYDDDYDDEDDEEYNKAVSILVPSLEQMTGRKVNVFHSYHQKAKNLTDWYIEPDGSLETDNSGDASCEIVSPPLPAVEAVGALKSFYGLAKQLRLYTNSTTGLHINVSIPGNLDVLKLAVFLGDQYVLKYFGRENSSYARSAERSIVSRATGAVKVATPRGKKTNPIGQPRTTVSIDMAKLTAMAKDATQGHTASISNNGKYFSFRHAGGNYLADFAGIYNSVGRFIRAMIIASDPALYRQEYLAKLAKLTGGPTGTVPNADTEQMISYLRTNGMPVVSMDIMRSKKNRSMDKIAQDAFRGAFNVGWKAEYAEFMTVVPNSATAKTNLLAKFNNPARKQKAEESDLSNFAEITIAPPNIRSLKNMMAADFPPGVNTFDSGFDTAGYYLRRKEWSPPTDPRTQTLIKQLLRKKFPKNESK